MSNLGLSAPITPTVPPQLQSVPSAEDLTRAFEFFNETSSLLSNSYRTLEGRVAQLTRELTEVSQAREEEHVKNHRLAERIQALLDFLPGGVIVLDERGYIVQSNPAAKSMLENPLDGFKWRDIISQCFAPRRDDGLEVSTHQGKRISIATASFDQTGQIILLTDQTETRRLQQQVARYEKLSAMGKMVSALAHQIRTPLSAALLYSNHLCNEDLEHEKRQAFAHKLLGRLQHMERQVRDMLLFVRNELPLNEVITLADLQKGLQEAMEVPLASSKSFCIWINPEPGLHIRCNREALISAVLNLVNNALQAKPGGNLAMRLEPITSANGLWLRLCVVDDGPGMSKEFIAQAKEL
ncbi:MAG TPA: histidine kinase dimerization/phospho-acceptor domain-containing protein, partial [Marinagarivorans sp.]|nr:histidine kinase dimerization/phospho-acceptor domain-containing protein [Marinagarivorans sp.]